MEALCKLRTFYIYEQCLKNENIDYRSHFPSKTNTTQRTITIRRELGVRSHNEEIAQAGEYRKVC